MCHDTLASFQSVFANFDTLGVSDRQVQRGGCCVLSRGTLHVCIEEGTWSKWLHEILSPHVIGSSSLRFAKPSQRGRQELHVQRHQEEQVCPEEEPIEAVTVGITEKIEEDDVG